MVQKVKAIMFSRLRRPATPQAPPVVVTRRIEVKAGNLGTAMGFGTRILVRHGKPNERKIEVKYVP